MCEGANSNTRLLNPLCSIAAVAVLLAVWQDVAAGAATLPFRPCVNTPTGVNVMLNQASCASPTKFIHVKADLDWSDERTMWRCWNM
ncbi:hypothetical protein E2C01_054393 [Portunus trituberculatus]|uniref:Uncharacterized protein n=1 Tax=Portunus trituberculatus TaxID=210409 RepID=A0A5B7GJQ4_PORTR|nr:hypothetical protein [Portunus trituberculatus]